MRRETQNILLVLLGGALLKITINGTYVRYVQPSLRPWLIATGVIMVLLAIVAIVRDVQKRPTGRHSAPHSHEDHDGHDHKASRSPWLLMLPVFAIFLIAPPALGSDSVNVDSGRSVAAQQPKDTGSSGNGSDFAPLPAGAVVPLKMSDFVTRVVWDDSGTLNGRTVRLTGFVVREKGVTYVARMMIKCCAADGTAVPVKLDGNQDQLGQFKVDSWIEVTGQVQPGTASEANNYVPSFTVSDIKQVPAPAEPYE